MSRADKPAFACASDNGHQPGMTLLEHYAGLAMQGLMANAAYTEWAKGEQSPPHQTADIAVTIAQALIAELEKVSP